MLVVSKYKAPSAKALPSLSTEGLLDLAPKKSSSKVSKAASAAFFAFNYLNEGGNFVAKVLAGGAEMKLQNLLKKKFNKVINFKPKSSRSDSSEKYVVALKFKKE